MFFTPLRTSYVRGDDIPKIQGYFNYKGKQDEKLADNLKVNYRKIFKIVKLSGHY